MGRLKESQNNLMDVIMTVIQEVCPDTRARRDYRMKYPDDIILHQLNGRFLRTIAANYTQGNLQACFCTECMVV